MQEILIFFLSSFIPFQRSLFLHVGPVFYLISYFFVLNKSLLSFLWFRPAGEVLFFSIYLCCLLLAAHVLLAGSWLWREAAVVAVHGFHCPTAGGVLVPHPRIKPCIGRWILNRWITRDGPLFCFLFVCF